MTAPVIPTRMQDLITDRIRTVPDFPRPGIRFRDITPLLADATAFSAVVSNLADTFGGEVDAIAGIEARGFLFAAPVAAVLGCSLIPIRKSGKLPPPLRQTRCELEYGAATLEVSEHAVRSGAHVAVLDDVLATGGSAAAACEVLESSGAEVHGLGFLLELADLEGRDALPGRDVHTMVAY